MGADLISSVAGPIVSNVLGGSGSSDVGSAVSQQQAGAAQASALYGQSVQQALGALNTNFNQAQSNINNYTGQAINQYAPYNYGGLTAYDAMMQAAGLPTLPGGSFSLQQALSANQANQRATQAHTDAQNALTQDLQNYVSARYIPGTAIDTVTQMPAQSYDQFLQLHGGLAGGAQVAINDINSTGAAGRTSKYFQTYNQYLPDIQAQLKAYNAPVNLTPLTSDQQNIVNNYNNGTLNSLATYNPTQAISQFLNSPQYSLLFNNGGSTMDPNATALQRFQASPGYQFSLNQGIQAADANAAAKGMALSGNQLQAITNFGTGLANQEYGNYQNTLANTYNNYYNNLAGIAGMGANATQATSNLLSNQGSQLAGINTQLGGLESQLYQGQGTVNANAALAAANAGASGSLYNAQLSNQLAAGIGNGLTKFLGSTNGTSFLNNIFGGSSSAANTSANASSFLPPGIASPVIGDSSSLSDPITGANFPFYGSASSFG